MDGARRGGERGVERGVDQRGLLYAMIGLVLQLGNVTFAPAEGEGDGSAVADEAHVSVSP